MDTTLKNWYIDGLSAYGIVKGHQRLSDGTFITSSEVKTVKVINEDTGEVEIQTKNTLYKANLVDAIFERFDVIGISFINNFNDLSEKFGSKYEFPDEILESEGIVIELSRNAEYNYVSCLANVDQHMYKELSPSVHLGMFQDSVLLRIRGLKDFDCRYFPHDIGTIEFYTWRTPYKTFIKNSSDIDIKISIFDFKKTVAPGEIIEVPKDVIKDTKN